MLATAWCQSIARIRRYLPSDSKQRPRSLLVVFLSSVTFVPREAAMTSSKLDLSNLYTGGKHCRILGIDCTSLFWTFRSGIVSAITSASLLYSALVPWESALPPENRHNRPVYTLRPSCQSANCCLLSSLQAIKYPQLIARDVVVLRYQSLRKILDEAWNFQTMERWRIVSFIVDCGVILVF